MKNLFWLSLFMLAACGSDIQQNPQVQSQQEQLFTQVNTAINKAQDNNDYRLMYTLGRNPVIPGFESKQLAELKQLCGLKPATGTGDVVKSPRDKQERIQKYQFVAQYNTKMYDICQSKQHK